MTRAVLMLHDKLLMPDGCIVEMKIWQVPSPVPASQHLLKYSLFYGCKGKRIVGYDNEAGKGDHRHLHEVETPYHFSTVEKLIADFKFDVEASRSLS